MCWEGGGGGGARCKVEDKLDFLLWSARTFRQHALNCGLCVTKATGESVAAAASSDQAERERAERALVVDKRDSLHSGTQNDLGVVGEEVDLHNKEQHTNYEHPLHGRFFSFQLVMS